MFCYMTLGQSNNLRLLEDGGMDDVAAAVIVIGGIVLLAIAAFCYFRKRGGRQRVEFEVFTNEMASAKESKDSSGTTNNIAYVSKDASYPKDDEDINTTS